MDNLLNSLDWDIIADQLQQMSWDFFVSVFHPELDSKLLGQKNVLDWLLCFRSSWWLSPTQPLTHSPDGMGLRIQQVKVRQITGWDKGSLIGKPETTQAKQNKEFIQHLVGRLLGSQESMDPSQVTWKDKYHCCEHLPYSLSFICWACHPMVRDIPLVSSLWIYSYLPTLLLFPFSYVCYCIAWNRKILASCELFHHLSDYYVILEMCSLLKSAKTPHICAVYLHLLYSLAIWRTRLKKSIYC